jgi:LuxR family maltose regulon positive regulatory protein
MRDDAAHAAELAPGDSTCRALCAFVCGVAAHLLGFRDEAEHELRDGTRRAAVTSPSLHALCLAQLAVLAFERDEVDEAAVRAARARAQVDRYGLGDDPVMALVFATSALLRAHRANAAHARGDIDAARRLAAALTDFAPWYEVETHILLARAELRLSDAGEARSRVADARRLVRLVPEAGVLAGWLGEIEGRLAAFGGSARTPEHALTTAELRVLAFLPTHLSFREIAERTYLSANTVKSQANAVYRKLGVSSRSEAVACARRLGLVDPAA